MNAYLGLVAGLGFGLPAAAAEWIVQPSVSVGAIRDDNIRLATGPHDTTSGYVAAARFDVQGKTETSETGIDAFITHSAYHSADVNDKTEQRVTLDFSNQTSERGTLGLDAEYRRDSLFETTVIEADGVGDVRDVDVGLSSVTEVRRSYRVLHPSWNWLLTERSSMQLAYRFTDVSFSDSAGTGLFDYRENLISGGYSRKLTPRDDIVVTANAFRFRPEAVDADAETLQLLVGMARAFSETLRGSFSIGASRTTERVAAQEEESGGTVLNATLSQRAELSTLEGVISRDVTPSGIGRALRTDQVRVYWRRGLATTVEFVFDAQWLRSQLIEGTDTGVDRRYYQLSPQLHWQWLENLTVVGSYRYRKQKYDASPDSADSNAVFLGVSYRL